MKKLTAAGLLLGGLSLLGINAQAEDVRQVFPHAMPASKPDIPLSAAMERIFDYPSARPATNELYTLFKHSMLDGFDYSNGDGTVSRRDPSRAILVDGTYYVWYTKRHTKVPPVGFTDMSKVTETAPSTDWDLAEIWYATSKDGFTWQEQGVAVPRPPKPNPGHRSVATADILQWKGKYYLYYQAFDEPSGLNGDHCIVAASVADSPRGPWKAINKAVVDAGQKGDWDQSQIQDPMPIVHNGQIYLYFKATLNKWPDRRKEYVVAQGLATADNPLGPFRKHPLNPVINSSHETFYFPYKEGIATLVTKDGPERDTVQYAKDGVNFEIASVISLPPVAGGPFTPDAFTDTKDGRGITWGLAHFKNMGGKGKDYSILSRFDCDLSQDVNEPVMRSTRVNFKHDVYLSQGISKELKEKFKQRAIDAAKGK